MTDNSMQNFTPLEKGLSQPMKPPVGHMPPNRGEFVVPHFATFSAVVNYASRSYYWQYDQAVRDSQQNALAMRNDPVIEGALNDRVIPTIQLEWELRPEDETDPKQVDCAAKLTKIIEKIPRLQEFKRCLLDALFYGRSGIQCSYGWEYDKNDEKHLVVRSWTPTLGDKIIFKFDGTPGILVNVAFYSGTTEGTGRGLAHFLTPEEQECFICHEVNIRDVDYYEQGLEAGSVHGIGFRGQLYWYWWLRNNVTQIMFDFVQKVSTGITVFYFESGNESSMAEVQAAAENQVGNNVYLFPRNRDGASAYSGPGIEVIPVSMTGAEFQLDLFNEFNSIMRQFILGESLTTEAGATGLGSGVSQAHESTAARRTKYDAKNLDFTMQKLVEVLNRYSFPDNPCPAYTSIVNKPDAESIMAACDAFFQMGGSLDEKETRKILGIPDVEPGNSVLSKINSLQPAAVNGTPQGIPMTNPTVGGPPQGEPQVQGQPVQQADQSQQPTQAQDQQQDVTPQ